MIDSFQIQTTAYNEGHAGIDGAVRPEDLSALDMAAGQRTLPSGTYSAEIPGY